MGWNYLSNPNLQQHIFIDFLYWFCEVAFDRTSEEIKSKLRDITVLFCGTNCYGIEYRAQKISIWYHVKLVQHVSHAHFELSWCQWNWCFGLGLDFRYIITAQWGMSSGANVATNISALVILFKSLQPFRVNWRNGWLKGSISQIFYIYKYHTHFISLWFGTGRV